MTSKNNIVSNAMKYTFINNFSKEKLIKLYPEIKSQNIQIAGANVLVLDYGLYKYKFPTLSEEVRRNQISDILIKISLPQNTTSRQRMKRIARDIYCQSFQLKQKHPLLRWHMINEKKFSWMINALPINLTIEPTNVCNLNCIGCRDGIDTQGFMKFKDFKKVLLQFKRIEKLYLYSRGEPLLHPDIMKFIDFAKNSGTKYMEISTNFNIKNDKLIEDIAKSKLDKLLIGLDGATQETYQGFRRGGNFGLVISNIKKIKAWAPHCKLEIQVMPNKFNEHEIDRIKVLAKVLGADSLRVRTFFSKDTDFLPMNSLYRYETPYKDLSTIDNLTLTTKKFICKEIMDS